MRTRRALPFVAVLGLAAAGCGFGGASGETLSTPPSSIAASASPEGQALCTLVDESGNKIGLDSIQPQSFGKVAIFDELSGDTTEGEVAIVKLDGTIENRLAVDFDLSNRTNRGKIILNFVIDYGANGELTGRVTEACHTGNSGETQYYTTAVPDPGN